VRERRNDGRRAAGRGVIARIAASIALRLWAKAVRRPVDTLAILGAVAASFIIIVNAVFLQSRAHPAPFVTNPTPSENRPNMAVAAPPKPAAASPPTRPSGGSRTPQPIAARRNDPIAELISASMASSTRIMAVQHVLSEFGYGQIRQSGIVDGPTSAAIEKFESEHGLPVTGRLSDRLLSELAAMTGRPID
jgi:Putative peptidoglycan binding domain